MHMTFRKLILLMTLLMSGTLLSAQDASDFYNEGLKLKLDKKSKEAMEKFRKALALKPDYTDALYEYGWCQNDLKDYSGAIITFRKARNGMPGIAKLYFELGYAFEKSIQYDSARVAYRKCLEISPGYSGAYRQLGYIAYEKEENAAALELFRMYEQKSPTPPSGYLYWFRKGYTLNALKQYDSARVALLRSLEFEKKYIKTYLELGYSATQKKQGDEAIGYFNEAILLDPKSHIPYNGIGEVYRDIKKDMDESMNWYRKTLVLNLKERKANYGMGYCLNAKGLCADAIPYLRTAIASETTYTAAYVELGYSLYKTKNYPEAGYNLFKAIELNPKNENAHYYLISMYVEQKDKVNAQKWLNSLRALNSKHVAALEQKVNAL